MSISKLHILKVGARTPLFLGGLFLVVFVACKPKRQPAVARVGRLVITETEFNRKLREIAPEYQNYIVTPNGRRQFLDVLIKEKMVLAVAADSGVRNTPEFKAEMEKLKTEEAEMLAEQRDHLLTRMWLEDLRKKGVISVSDEEARQYHAHHPTEVRVRHIQLATPEEAEAILRRLKGGASFAALAQEKSLDADTASHGGEMRPMIYGEIIPELEDVVFKSKVGELVGPVRTKMGYHVLKKDREYPISFQAAEERIHFVMEKQKLDQYLQSVQARYPVEVTDGQIN